MIKILIADDHPVVRKGLKEILTEAKNFTEIDEASDGQQVLHMVGKKKYSVIVLDISMPGLNGLDVLKQLKTSKPKIPILVLSRYPEEQYAVRVLKAGADGFLTKESAPEELINAIEKIAHGGSYISSSLAEKLAVYVKDDSGGKPHEKLSDREFEIMRMIAAGKTVKEIARDLSLNGNTVSTYRARIMQKMGFRTGAQLTAYALRAGLIESAEDL